MAARRVNFRAELGFATVECTVEDMGDDVLATLRGGEPHIGCSVLAVPRPSLRGDGTASATSSVLNVTGHKDDVACRLLAERLCAATGRIVACVGGIHVEAASPKQIELIMQAVEDLAQQATAGMR